MEGKTRKHWGDQQDGTYRNPILNADYSDPDIVREGDTYYMITSTFQFSPGMAILESKDLINWKTINYAMDNLDELCEDLNWTKMNSYNQGVYAGSLRHLKWKEKRPDGTYVDKSKWYMYTTIINGGIVVATADDIYGKWTCDYMKDKNGLPVKARQWDDNCPYWEFNEDGTRKAAYMISSNPGFNWYLHMFQMSLDGMQLLDGDVRYMQVPFDTVRRRTGVTPKEMLFEGDTPMGNTLMGDPNGEVLDKYTGEPIPSANRCGLAHRAVMNEYGDIKSTTNAYQILGREGVIISDISSVEASKIIRFDESMAHRAVMNEYGDIKSTTNAYQILGREGVIISDISSVEASKIIRFDESTAIGKTTFTGRHGENQKVSDYIYIFSSEYWDDTRIPLLRRAKCIYGDIFDENGVYVGPGSPEQVGVYETQRICVNTTVPYDMREPNQGGYIDVPAELAEDHKEHWYWITQHGNNFVAAECRPTSLLPVTWVEGWPLVGELDENGEYLSKGIADSSADPYDGTGLNGNTNDSIHHPQAKYKPGRMGMHYKKPPIKGKHPILNFQDSDNFGSGPYAGQQNSINGKLSPNWMWNYVPRNAFWSLTQRPGYFRLYAFSTVDGSRNLFCAGNILSQRYIAASHVLAEIKIDICHMKPGQEAGLIHFNGGKSYSSIGIIMDEEGKKYLSFNQKDTEILVKEYMKPGQEAGLIHFNGGKSYSSIGIIMDEEGKKYLSFNQKDTEILVKESDVILRSMVDDQAVNEYWYSVDQGETFHKCGEPYELSCGGYRGDCIGIYTYNNHEKRDCSFVPDEETNFGYIDVEYFRYEYER